MDNFLLHDSPPLIQPALNACWQRLGEAGLQAKLQSLPEPEKARFRLLIIASHWAMEQLCRHPQWLDDLLAHESSFPGSQGPDSQKLSSQLQQKLAGCDDEPAFYQALRQFRNFHQLLIIWRDVNRLADMPQTGRSISLLADTLVKGALDWLYKRFCEKHGTPADFMGQPQQLLVIGMGKLGGNELNLSSDIDLIFAYASDGETSHPEKPISHQQFFLRLGQALIKALSQQTADGFCYRVDMRLRPFGASGPLACTFNALENYFLVHGREWERYAMVKARVITGSGAEKEQLQQIITPFVYRRYLDFAAIDSMRDMKQMIQSEVRRKGLDNNVKLGAGGIREAEFIAQTFQLIKGGRDQTLHERNLLACYQQLLDEGSLDAQAAAELTQAYCFLRNSEHVIQCFKDQQTQNLPIDPIEQQRFALAMGFASFDEYLPAMESHRIKVNTHFKELVSEPQQQQQHSQRFQPWQKFWLDEIEACPEAARAFLMDAGFSEQAFMELAELKMAKRYTDLQDIGRQRLDSFLPTLLGLMSERANAGCLFKRLMPLIEAIMRRSNYLSLLQENPEAVTLLLDLCENSEWLAKQFVANPILLDELLDEDSFYSMPDAAGLEAELRQQLLRIEADDLEAQMETLRYFRLAHGLRVAAMELKGKIPLMKVSDYLTWIAEAILSHVLNLAWLQMSGKHGFPTGEEGVFDQPRFIIVAYGKLGGLELSHGSDLDLVFIHDAPVRGMTNGERALDNSVFFTRLGQRIIHILNTRTSLGPLYEVDMRLRPSGASGLLVSSMNAFEIYQFEKAWPWEHQALVRARAVAGHAALGQYFQQLRKKVMQQKRDSKQLADEVQQMRNKMREQLLKTSSPGMFHLKHGFGGIVDIEFMVQYAVLAWSHLHPDLAEFTDNIRILQSLANTGLLDEEDCQKLMASYQYYRTLGHQNSLRGHGNEVPIEVVEQQASHVMSCWQKLLGQPIGELN